MRVIIEGAIGEGKSALAAVIAFRLRDLGIDVTLHDPDGVPSLYESSRIISSMKERGAVVPIEMRHTK